MKRGLNGLDSRARSALRGTIPRGWALCVGAGISQPAFPLWMDLAKSIMDTFSQSQSEDSKDSYDLLNQFTPDVILQAAFDRSGRKSEEFATLLSDQIYKNLFTSIGPRQKAVIKCLGSVRTALPNSREWESFLEGMETAYPELTALPLADQIYSLIGTELAPRAILSFNAEPLLFALINAFQARSHNWENRQPQDKNKPTEGPPPQLLDAITRSIAVQRKDRIPYYFLHGLLRIPGATKKPHKSLIAEEKLVFIESDYVKSQSTLFSWNSASFFSVCLSFQVVFIGVSLSDANMRSWLSLIHSNKQQEISDLSGGKNIRESTSHLWIRRRPQSEAEEKWIEASVSDLGVRLVWIDEWADVCAALRNLLAI